MIVTAFALVFSTAVAAHTSQKPSDAVATLVRRSLHATSYERADADLNGDGRPEAFVYVTDASYCGSGGCTLLVLSPSGSGYREVLRSTVTQLPIRLLPTASHGWRDVGVTVAGGGITRSYMARLRFNGRRYPSNPTVPPAEPAKGKSGRVLIGR